LKLQSDLPRLVIGALNSKSRTGILDLPVLLSIFEQVLQMRANIETGAPGRLP
jgi:hypothetical protein